MGARLVDFHCHLDLYNDPVAAIAEAESAGVYTLTVTTTPKAWPRNLVLTRGTNYIRAALGLHPQVVAERSDEISLLEKHLPEARYIGEVGLDAGPRYFKSFSLQREVFQRILRMCSRVGGKILSVHSVRATKQVLDSIEDNLPANRGGVVLHWFTGNKSEVRRAVDMGCYFSINAEMIRNERHHDLVKSIPLERVLTETDGPFTISDGIPSCPKDVLTAVNLIAAVYNVSPTTMAGNVFSNLRTLLESV